MSNKTASGLDENLASALSYVLGPITGLVFLIIERENKNVRFHALQSFIYFGAIAVLNFILGLFVKIPLIGYFVGIAVWALSIISFVSLIYLVISAYQGKMFKIPIIGEIVFAQVNK